MMLLYIIVTVYDKNTIIISEPVFFLHFSKYTSQEAFCIWHCTAHNKYFTDVPFTSFI